MSGLIHSKSTKNGANSATHLPIPKTIKLFINGEFPRTESGRSYPVLLKGTKTPYAHLCLSSRKDHRNAVTAALEAQKSWAARSAYNRCQILYRMGEMMESKRESLNDLLVQVLGIPVKSANLQVSEAIDCIIYYAGFTDKYQQMIGSVNPVNGPHHNFTTPEPVGVVGLLCNEQFDLAKICADIAGIMCSGNTLITLLPGVSGVITAELGEIFATSDLPKGVINILSGSLEELYAFFGSHMEIDSVSFQLAGAQNQKKKEEIQKLCSENMKRFSGPAKNLKSLENILNFIEYKTVWHPIGVW